MNPKSSRRQFLRQTAALSTAVWVHSAPLGWTQPRSALETIRFACIGVDGRGSSDCDDAGRRGEIVALCDVDEERLSKAALRFPKARKFSDYRKMYDEIGKDFDAVTISTPDHTHAPAAVRAMRMGKHCFCQKPLSYTVAEARLMREVAAEKHLCTQMGNQGTAATGHREAIEIIRRGDIGQVKEVHVWTNRPAWPQGQGRPATVDPVPPTLNWEAFLGPAPERPFHREAYHPFNWRGWIDFGTGALGDMACHLMNTSVTALRLYDPLSVEATTDPDWAGAARQESFPKFSTIRYEFGQRGEFGPCSLIWYDGGQRPSENLHPGIKQGTSGSLVIGEKGSIFSSDDYHNTYTLLPSEKFTGLPKPVVIESPGHFSEFALAIKEGKPELAMSNFEHAGRLTETVLLGNVALRAGKKIEWNSADLKVTNDSDANRFVTREYRTGWGLS